MNKNDEAVRYFESGCNCSQAVVMPYAEELNIAKEAVERMAVAFGGGMSKAGKTCGCVTGALMVIGLKYGESSASTVAKRIESYNEGNRFLQLFNEMFGATECRELIKLDLNNKADMEHAQKSVFGSRCKSLVNETVKLLEKHFMNRAADDTIQA